MLAIPKSKDDFLFSKISSLRRGEMYWTIKIQVIQKDDMKVWDSQIENSKLLKFIASDETGSISITAFGNLADKFFHKIEVFI